MAQAGGVVLVPGELRGKVRLVVKPIEKSEAVEYLSARAVAGNAVVSPMHMVRCVFMFPTSSDIENE
jgi:hypothetical protein